MPFSDTSTAAFLFQIFHILGLSAGMLLMCFLPGWRVAREISSDPEIRTIVSCMLSFVLVYGVVFGAYLLGVDQMYAVMALALCCVPSVLCLAQEKALSFGTYVQLLLVWLCAVLFFLLPQIYIFAPGAPTGMWDWVEHWLRAKLFLNGGGLDTKVGGYSMAARGPLFNAVVALFMKASSNQEYFSYQIAATALNLWFVLPLYVALRRLCGIPRNWAILFALLTGFISWDLAWSTIYPWTKIFTAGLMLGSIVCYFRGLEEDSGPLTGFGLAGFAIAFLSHYFAFPCAVFFWGHYAVTRIWRDRKNWTTGGWALGASAALVSSWFFPCFAKLGIVQSLSSNTTIGNFYTNTQTGVVPNYFKVLLFNVISGFAPVNIEPLLGIDKWVPKVADWIAVYSVVYWHDGRQMYNEAITSLTERKFFSGILGSVAWAKLPVAIMILALLLYGIFLLRKRPSTLTEKVPGKAFWILFWTLGQAMHSATSRDYAPGGSGILWLYSMIMFAAVFSVLQRLPYWIRLTCLGVLTVHGLNLILETVIIQSVPVTIANGQPQTAINAKVFAWHIQNAMMKAQNQAVLLYDHFGSDRVPVTVALFVAASALTAWLMLSKEPSSDSLKSAKG